MRTRTTAIGDYQLSLMNGRPAVVLGQPLLDDDGRITRVVAGAIDLDQVNAVFKTVSLPRGAVRAGRRAPVAPSPRSGYFAPGAAAPNPIGHDTPVPPSPQ